MTSLTEAHEEACKIASLIQSASRLIAEGSLLDLSTLGERIARFSKDVMALPSAEGCKVRADIDTLLTRLAALETDLRVRLAPRDAASPRPHPYAPETKRGGNGGLEA